MEYKNKKFGFTLFEVVVTMGIVVIFIAACSNIFTQQHKNRVANPAHGRVECYWRDGHVHQRTFFENMQAGDDIMTNGKCHFTPNRSASYVMISAVGGGGAGGPVYGGSAGEYINMFLPNTTHHLELIPGLGAKRTLPADPEGETLIEEKGHNTVVTDIGVEGNDSPITLLDVVGGESNSYGSTNATVKLGDCAVTYSRFTCGLPYSCEADNETRTVKLRYCTQSGVPAQNPYQWVAQKDIQYSTILANYQGDYSGYDSDLADGIIKYESSEDTTADIDTYCDISGYKRSYVLALTVIGNNTPYQDRSPMEGYINAIGIVGGMGGLTVSPGNGGAKEQEGGDGAVVIVW